MEKYLPLNEIANEIYRREQERGKNTDLANIKTILRHVGDLMAEEWRLNFDLNVAHSLRTNGMGRLKGRK